MNPGAGVVLLGGGFLLLWAMGNKAVNTLTTDIEQRVQKLANGISIAEGFWVSGSRPQRNNNPGNLTADLIGRSIGKDGMYVIYSTAADGWDALRKQVRMMLTGASRIYRPDMTISEMATKYTTTEQSAWAANVARSCGCSVSTRLNDV